MANRLVQEFESARENLEAQHAPKIEAAILAMVDAHVEQIALRGQVGQTPEGSARMLSKIMYDMWRDSAMSAGRIVETEFKDGFTHLETKAEGENLFMRIASSFISAFGGNKVVQIVQSTRQQIRTALLTGQRNGEALPDIARRISENATVIARQRAALIARTEIHTASQYASNGVARESRIPLMKMWNSVEDSRTRDFGEGDGEIDRFNHRVMDEVKVPMDQPFKVPNRYFGHEEIMFPGDPDGSAGNVINCRCVQTYERQR